jgi:hypothetical protein
MIKQLVTFKNVFYPKKINNVINKIMTNERSAVFLFQLILK